ncbi:MAG TPA: hypothetical protein VH022_03185 [Candidatus Acidoferrum sp.]|nr:hypothetical protein [Candidatus Acidoferrum sp.]
MEKFEFAPAFPPRFAHMSTAEPLATYRGHLLFFLCERSVSGSGEVVEMRDSDARLR